jgi:hypothetical protein
MRDPVARNIRGSKVETHEFSHHIDWGHVALAVAAVVVVYAVFLRSRGEEEGGVP